MRAYEVVSELGSQYANMRCAENNDTHGRKVVRGRKKSLCFQVTVDLSVAEKNATIMVLDVESKLEAKHVHETR